ncbi:hypothetical protein [Dyadobacter sp. CY323]|uniref:hypothetical protein n=1 Tax=Dyadobacter sp. CY323 TaxID=2907302 RepID=UPI001F375354|nr:hypothetical protein [Dyadobacter sp. CY323]MCE6990089.1 hypothetical protein [Dyadobacter sp. CY323]
MKKLIIIFIFFIIQRHLAAQGVGINTTNPDASAVLEIKSSDKGVLIPRVSLTSVSDNSTIILPSTSLLVYNTNSTLPNGSGFYFNGNTPQAPVWTSVSSWNLPFYAAASPDGAAFQIEVDQAAGADGVAIKGFGVNKGVGIYAQSSSGKALIVDGFLKLTGDDIAPPAVGRILTSDDDGNASWQGAIAFKATGVKGSGSEKIAKNVLTKIPFASEQYDLQESYTNSEQANHSTFTAPTRGIYRFDAMIAWEDINVLDTYATELFLRRQRNGGWLTLNESRFDTPGGNSNYMSSEVILEAGDQISIWCEQGIPDYLNLNTDQAASYFSGRLLIKL